MLSKPKTKQICKNKKERLQYILSLDSDNEEIQGQFSQKEKAVRKMPMTFSELCKDESIGIQQTRATVDSSRFSQGQVTLSTKLQRLISWKLKMCSISLAAFFGICEVSKRNKVGAIYGLYSAGYGPNKYPTGEQFQNDTWIKLTYSPEKQTLTLFNQKAERTFQISIPKKGEDFDYYPYVFLYKSTVYLQQVKEMKESTCFSCGQIGHYSNQCPKGKKKLDIKCYRCKKQGHFANQCKEE